MSLQSLELLSCFCPGNHIYIMGYIATIFLLTNALIACILAAAATEGASGSTSWTNWATKLTMPVTTANDVIDTQEADSVKTLVRIKSDDQGTREMHVLRYKDLLDEDVGVTKHIPLTMPQSRNIRKKSSERGHGK